MYRFVRKKMRPKRAMKPHAHATIVALRGPSLSEIVPNTMAAIAVPIMYAVIANPLVTVSKPASIARVGTMEANASVPVSSTMKMKKNQNVGVFSACLDVRPGRFFAASAAAFGSAFLAASMSASVAPRGSCPFCSGVRNQMSTAGITITSASTPSTI